MRQAVLLLAMAAAALPDHLAANGLGADFLMFTPDARTLALGSAGVALDDLDANTYYNPANLTFSPRLAATWTHCYWSADMSADYAGIGFRPAGRLSFAGNVLYRRIGPIRHTDEHGRLIGTDYWYDVAPSVSAAYHVNSTLSTGLTTKAIYWRIGPVSTQDALTFALDAGVQYRPHDAVTLGLAVANMGPNISYYAGGGDFLPRVVRLGLAARPSVPGPVSALLTGELSINLFPAVSYYEPWHAGAGLELGFARLAFLRLGCRSRDGDGGWRPTWGAGLEHRGIRLDVGLDDRDNGYPPWEVRYQFSYRR
jgi:hypothetical protein